MNTSIVEDVKHQLERVGGGSHLTVDQRHQLIVQGCHQVRGEGVAPTAGAVTRLQSQYLDILEVIIIQKNYKRISKGFKPNTRKPATTHSERCRSSTLTSRLWNKLLNSKPQ